MKLFQFETIKSRLAFWFLIIAILPLVLLNIIIYEHMVQSRKEAIFNKLEAVRDLKVEGVNNWIDERTGDVRTIVSDPHIRNIEKIHEGKEEDIKRNIETVSMARDHLKTYLENYDSFYEIAIISPHTQKVLICTTEKHEGRSYLEETSFYKVFQRGEINIRDIQYSAFGQRPSMAFYIPIYGLNKENHIFGILVASINLEASLYDLLLNRTGMGDTGETLIVNRDVVALNELRWHENAPLNLKIKAHPAVEASRGNTGIVETEDYRGEMVLAAYTHIPRTGWGFVAKQDLKEVYATIHQLGQWVISLGIFTVIGVMIAAFRVSKSISDPIKSLHEGSEIIGSGDLDYRVGTDLKDEIGQLSRGFDGMTDKLKKSRTALQVEISERRKAEERLQQSYEIFETVLDSIDGIVYVADIDTYEILYANKYLRDIFGDLKGEVCWKTLQTGQTAPCSFCTNDKLLTADGKPADVYKWEFQNTVNSRWYDIRDRAIEWIDGRVVRLEIAVDSTERKKAEHAIKKREKQLSESQKVARLGSWEWDIINNKIEWSDELYQIFGVDSVEFKATYEAFLNMVHPDDKEKLEAAIKESLAQKIPYHIDVRIIRPDGSEWIMEARGEVKCDQSGNPVMIGGTAQDITERKKIEEKIKASLKEKEVLIREIHHRVKNNMAVISSLLKLQAGKIADDKYREMFNDSMGRIKSMALIHEKLYRSEDIADIDFGSYLEEIVTGIFSSYRLIPGRVSLKMEVENISIGIDDAVPLGLLINELVSNSLKHGFPEGREGVLRVTLRKIHQSSLIELIVSDDGVGMPEGLDFRETGSLGLNLVATLTRQLHGEIEMSREKGTEFRITFMERT